MTEKEIKQVKKVVRNYVLNHLTYGEDNFNILIEFDIFDLDVNYDLKHEVREDEIVLVARLNSAFTVDVNGYQSEEVSSVLGINEIII